MEAKSKQIYQFLCDDVVGSERVVKYRRLFFKTYEYTQNKFCSPSKYIIASGSKAEGLDMPGSDLDIMLVSKQHLVYETIPQFEDKLVDDTILSLKIDYANAQPGFVLLKIYDRPYKDFDDSLILRNEDGYFFSSNLYLKNLVSKYPFSSISTNGPCLSNIFLSIALDVAHSLKCQKWPTVAGKWLCRHRSSGWPSANLISMISKELVLLVPVGSKSDSGKSHPLEWRISFSVPEKKLIHTWTHTHMLCYALLKFLIKDVLKQNQTISDLLCSYFIKTVIFWLSEELDATWWTPIHLMDCFVACLGRLTYLISHKYIPNYFVPQHNMIDRHFTQQIWNELLSFMVFLHGMGWQSVFLCDSLKKLMQLKDNIPLQEHVSGCLEFNKAVIPLLSVFKLHFLDVEYCSVIEASKKCICLLTKTNVPNKIRILFSFFLTLSVSPQVLNKFSGMQGENKQKYLQLKKNRALSLFLSQLSGKPGWICLAVNFYLWGQYKKTFIVLDYAKNIFTLSGSIISLFTMPRDTMKETLHVNRLEGYMSKLRRLIFHSQYDTKEYNIHNITPYGYLLQLFPYKNFIQLPSEVLIDYLRFACCHNLQDIFQRQQCLHDLTLSIETLMSEKSLSVDYSVYLTHAYHIAYD